MAELGSDGPISSTATAPRASVEIEARTGEAFKVRAGDLVRVTDVDGKQVGDFVVYVPEEDSFLSPVHTRGMLGAVRWRVGDCLYSALRTPLLRVVGDDVGCHDFLFPACDARRYELDYGDPNHANCKDILRRALEQFDVDAPHPEPINLFMNVPLQADGAFAIEEPRSRPGDAVTFEAMVDVIAAISACPQDRNPCNGWNPTGLRVEIYSPAGKSFDESRSVKDLGS